MSARYKKSELQKAYPESNIDFLIMMLEHEMFMKSFEASKIRQFNELFSGDGGYINQLTNMFAKRFSKVEKFTDKQLSQKSKFLSDWNKLKVKMIREITKFLNEMTVSTYNYNRQYFLWMLDELIPELDIYEKPNVSDFTGEMLVGESKSDNKLYDPGYSKAKMQELINTPRYAKTTNERFVDSMSRTDMAIKSVFNDAITPLSDGKGRTYLSVLKRMEKAMKDNVQRMMKRAIQLEVQGVAEDVETNMMEMNNHLVGSKWQRVEILDGKTCMVCASQDGKVSNKRLGRIHPNCRGKDIVVITENGKVTYRQRKGRPRNKDSFERWFNKLPKDEKQRVLGKTKYNLWQAGEFDLKEFVKGNRVASLKELEKQKAISDIKSQLTDMDNAVTLIDKFKEQVPVKSIEAMSDTSHVNEYEKFLNAKLEVYKAIPNNVLRDNGTDRRTLIAEVKRERSLLDIKRKQLNLLDAQRKYQESIKNIDN